MSKIIEGVPEFISHAQYLSLFEACGFNPSNVVEMRMAHDGVHALVFAKWPDGSRRVERLPITDGSNSAVGFYKHRVFIPVRREDGDERTTRVTDVQN